MGRLGSRFAQSAVYSLALGHDEPAYEPYKGQFSMQMIDEPERMQMPIADAPFQNFYTYGSVKKDVEKMKAEKLKLRNNHGSEIELKMPKRVEGLRFSSTMEYPTINIGDEPDYAYMMPYKLGEMTEAEQIKVTTVFPKSMPSFKVSYDDEMEKRIAKVEDAYQIDKLNTQEPLEFIQQGRGEFFTELSDNNAIDAMGSTIKENNLEIQNAPLKAKTDFELYKESLDPHTKSRVQDRQRMNMKSRQMLNLYSGQPAASQPMDQLAGFLHAYERNKRVGQGSAATKT
jgi:hypothetical protein